MKDVLIIISSNIPCICFIALSAWMMHTGTPGHGWVILVAATSVLTPKFSAERKASEDTDNNQP